MDNEFNNNQENNKKQNLNNTVNNQNNENSQKIIQFGNSINPETSSNMNFDSNLYNQNKTFTNTQNNNMINNQSIQNNVTENIYNSPISNNVEEQKTSTMNNIVSNESKENNIINDSNNFKSNDNNTGNIKTSKVKEDELEKIANSLNLDFLVLAIFSIIAFVYLLYQGSFEITYLIELAILIVGYIGSNNRKSYAAVCGIVTGVLMFFSDIISIVLGIFIFIRSIKYNKVLKTTGQKTKTLLFSILGIIGIILITVIVKYIDLFGGHALKCTRSNGDIVEVKFDPEGISSLKINNKDAESIDFAIYKLQFTNEFFFNSYNENSSKKIDIYRKIVKEYEEKENGAICK